ncbi:MAG: rhomboid family intramembrane serine protease [Pseudomonadota bacterium]
MFNANLPASTTLFWITIAISLIGLYLAPALIRESLFRPYWFIKKNQFYTIITSGLVHADIGHLLMNMVTFYFFAFPLEARIGTGAFLVLYVLALVLSSVSTWYKHLNDPNYATLGASGAI